jgi:hypothetical protein
VRENIGWALCMVATHPPPPGPGVVEGLVEGLSRTILTDKGVVRRARTPIWDLHGAPRPELRGALTLVWPVQVSVGFAMDALHRLSRHGHPLVTQAVLDVMDEATCLLPKESLLRTQDGLTKY